MPARPKPSLLLVPVRALLITFLISLLCFAVSLLLGIVGCVTYTKITGHPISLALAYRLIAFPTSAIVAIVVLIISFVTEARRYRDDKALAAIERAG
jgi:hypothetical protein